eukprot:Nitzschia sp. Nitz4//scaffold22_size323478//40623//41357//NITZ4_000501-RA/size323478-augustus-gene-0.223-mRNA-1//-1//CDS//3329542917//4352//frame0
MSFITIAYKTVQYAWHVEGFRYAPSSTLIARQGTKGSDSFRISLPNDQPSPVSLQSFQLAFLTSPLFALERLILRLVLPRSEWPTLTTAHMHTVAQGAATKFGLWEDRSSEGDLKAMIPTEQTSATRIMRASMPDGKGGWIPFVDTWWCVEMNPTNESVDFVFGSALHSLEDPKKKDWLLEAAMPLHVMYSRLLLACARANWEEQNKKGR